MELELTKAERLAIRSWFAHLQVRHAQLGNRVCRGSRVVREPMYHGERVHQKDAPVEQLGARLRELLAGDGRCMRTSRDRT